jgi:hypothetical protein
MLLVELDAGMGCGNRKKHNGDDDERHAYTHYDLLS